MSTSNNGRYLTGIEKLKYMRAWARQSSWTLRFGVGTVVGGATLAGLGALIIQAGGSGTGMGMMVAPAAWGYLALFNQYRDSLYAKYRKIFASRQQAKSLLANADFLLAELAGDLGSLALKDGLRYVASNLSYQSLSKLSVGKTINTRDLKKTDTLSKNDGEAGETLVRACLFALVSNYKEYQAKSVTTSQSSTLELPIPTQHYIAEHYNYLISIDPTLFGKEVLDNRQPGLYAVVQSLVAMQCSLDETRTNVKIWLEAQRSASPVNVKSQLPPDLFG